MRRDPCSHEGVSRRSFLNLTCLFFLLAGCLAEATISSPASAQTIIDEWATVKAPPAPELKPVTIDPKGTALLVLDIQRQICPPRPRCVASVPKIQVLLAQARARGVAVIYSIATGTAADILKEKGIRTVIVVGTAAHGAVLHTSSEAAFRGLKVIVPVDGMAADNLFAEQYTAWHLVNAPRLGPQVTLTRIDMIQFP